MDTPSLEQLAAINRQLARSNNRVENFLARLIDRVDDLVAASLDKDWDEVRRQCDFLAIGGEVYGLDAIVASARSVRQRIDDRAETSEIQRELTKLIGRCGSARADREAAMAPEKPKN
jgi:hypothetical protein